MMDIAPEGVVTIAALGNEAVDMGVPFQIPAEGVEDHDKARCEVHGFILLQEHTGNDTGDRMEKAVEEGAVVKEKVAQLLINGEDTVAVGNINEFKRHRGSTFQGIFIAARGTEAAMAAEGDKFKLTAMGAGIHGAAKGGVTAG